MNEEQLLEFNTEMQNGENALHSKDYMSAWDHFYRAHNLKKEFYKSKRVSPKNVNDEDYAKSCYFLAQIIKEIGNRDELIERLKNEDEDLIANKYKGSKARKFIGRKYLKLAADKDYHPAIVEYALNCLGYAPQGRLDFEYNDSNLETAVYWANTVMKRHKNKYVSAMGYCIDAIYCLDEYKQTKNEATLIKFADNILEANKINGENFDQYITYHLGYLYSFPKLEDYKNGKYYDCSNAIRAFEEVIEKGSDEYLIRAAKKLKEGLEKYNG